MFQRKTNMKDWYNWWKLLRSKGYSFFHSIEWAYYNNKYWKPKGDWPYGMEKRDRSFHRQHTIKYEDLCM